LKGILDGGGVQLKNGDTTIRRNERRLEGRKMVEHPKEGEWASKGRTELWIGGKTTCKSIEKGTRHRKGEKTSEKGRGGFPKRVAGEEQEKIVSHP